MMLWRITGEIVTKQHIKVIVENNSYIVNVTESSESGFVGNCIELPAAISQGESISELEKNIKEAIMLVLQEHMDK